MTQPRPARQNNESGQLTLLVAIGPLLAACFVSLWLLSPYFPDGRRGLLAAGTIGVVAIGLEIGLTLLANQRGFAWLRAVVTRPGGQFLGQMLIALVLGAVYGLVAQVSPREAMGVAVSCVAAMHLVRLSAAVVTRWLHRRRAAVQRNRAAV